MGHERNVGIMKKLYHSIKPITNLQEYRVIELIGKATFLEYPVQ